MSFFDDPVTAMAALPALGVVLPLFILLSALMEYVFPPYWGDLVVLLGFFLAGQSEIQVSPWTIFVAALAGSVLGSAAAFLLGRRYGLAIVRRVVPWRPTGSRQRMRELLDRFGEQFLVVNRFLPFIRGLMLFGAGAFKLRFASAMAYTTLSNLLWTAFLMTVGLLTAGNWEQILETFRYTNQIVASAVGVLALGWALLVFWRRQQNT